MVMYIGTHYGKDKSKEFALRALDVDMRHMKSTAAPGTKGTSHFKVQLIDASDPDSTGGLPIRHFRMHTTKI